MDTHALLSRAAELIRNARHPVALTGAGISTPSGIPDFRSLDSGLWNKVNPLSVASIYAFRIRPRLFFDWIRPLARIFMDAVPNPAHLALARLEQMGQLKTIITQNIDGLHQKAGSENVIEVHGHIRSAMCVRCHREVSIDALLPRFLESRELPRCEKCGGVLKPNIILYGERLPVQAINAARRAARACDRGVLSKRVARQQSAIYRPRDWHADHRDRSATYAHRRFGLTRDPRRRRRGVARCCCSPRVRRLAWRCSCRNQALLIQQKGNHLCTTYWP